MSAGVFWSGVGLAALAALVMLVGNGMGMLKIGSILAVLAVVLIGLSMTLRRDSQSTPADAEQVALAEIEMARRELREDIAAAARATHRSFEDRLQAVYEAVDTVRGQLGAAHDGYDRDGYDRRDMRSPVGAAGPASARVDGAVGRAAGVASVGVVRHTETVHVTTRQTIVDGPPEADHSQAHGGTVYGMGLAAEYGRYGVEQSQQQPQRLPYDRGPAVSERSAMPEVESRRSSPAAGYGRSDDRSPPPRVGHGEPPLDVGERRNDPSPPREESWTEQLLRGRLGEAAARAPDPAWSGFGRTDRDEEHWSGMRAGDRWASVRRDDHGRELRVGERRAAALSDETGSEFRVEDRWTSVRHEDSGRERDGGLSERRDFYGGHDGWNWGDDRDAAAFAHRGQSSWKPIEAPVRERTGPRPALPSASGRPADSWAHGRGQPDAPESRGHDESEWRGQPGVAPRARADAWRGDEPWAGERRAGGAADVPRDSDLWDRREASRIPRQRRMVDFEATDDRWR